MRSLVLLLIASLIVLYPSGAISQIHRYVDSDGLTHYVDDPAKVPEEYRKQLDQAKPLPPINRADFLPKESKVGSDAPAAPTLPTSPKVEIFVTDWCPYCTKLEEYLRANQIKFTRYDIEKSPVGKRKHQELGGGGIPLVKIGSQVIRGFDVSSIQQALKR